MIFKLSSRFIKGDPKYEPPFYVNVCDRKSSKETQVSQKIAKLKKLDAATIRVTGGKNYGYWGIAELIYNDRWTRWYTIEKVSVSKEPETKSSSWKVSPGYYSTASSFGDFTITYHRV